MKNIIKVLAFALSILALNSTLLGMKKEREIYLRNKVLDFEGLTERIKGIQICPDNRNEFATEGAYTEIIIWKKNEKKTIIKLKSQNQCLTCFGYCTSNPNLIVSGGDKLCLHDKKKENPIVEFSGYKHWPLCLGFTSNGEKIIIITGGNYGELIRWDTDKEDYDKKLNECVEKKPVLKFDGHNEPINHICFIPNNSKKFATGACGGELFVWKVDSNRYIKKINSAEKWIAYTIAFCGNDTSKFLVSRFRDVTLRSIDNGEILKIFPEVSTGKVEDLRMCEGSENYFVTLGLGGRLCLLNKEDDRYIKDVKYPVEKNKITAFCFSGEHIIVSTVLSDSSTKTLELWERPKEIPYKKKVNKEERFQFLVSIGNYFFLLIV